jgi:tRNA(His) guanylyltransferase
MEFKVKNGRLLDPAQGRATGSAGHRSPGRAGTAEKNGLLFQHGINFNEVPAWQRRGIGLQWQTYQRPGYDPVRRAEVTATRRRIAVERELPMKEAYRDLIRTLCSEAAGSAPS